MKKLLYCLLIIFSTILSGQDKPRLVVGIVVDQMRYDYLSRFYNDFEEGGFKRLIEDGFLFKNAHYDYTPTKTGPGHASIYTGTTPARHGIIGNDWFARAIDRQVNCVEDTTASVVGGDSNGKVSPRNLFTTTITDELRLYYNFNSKVVGVSLKDRGAALPAGHNPTGAYWYDLRSGNMITSTYYAQKLPTWVNEYNKQERPFELITAKWELLKDESIYNESIADQNEYEQPIRSGMGVTFPHDLSQHKKDPSIIKYTPFTNTIIREIALKAVEGEELGKDSIPDFLAISFSATDDVGHRFGPRSMEVQDTYLRLDLELKEILTYLDQTVGKDNYLVFLSADHGATDVPSYLYKNKMPAGYHNNGYIKSILNEELAKKYGEGKWISSIINEQIYLNHSLINEKGLDPKPLKQIIIERLLKEDYVVEAFDRDVVAMRMFTDPTLIRLQNGYNNKRSGDVLYNLTPSNLNDAFGRKGTDHRTPYAYDTHIPIIFYGKGIKKGSSVRKVDITDIAPSLSLLLDISLPSGSSGEPLKELFD